MIRLNLVDEIIHSVQAMAKGRTRYEGQKPYNDEILVEEILNLRKEILFLKSLILSQK